MQSRVTSKARLARTPLVGSIGAGLAVQLSLVVSGVLTARMLGVENRGYLALLQLVATVVPQVVGVGLPLAVTYALARESGSSRGIMRAIRVPVLIQVSLTLALSAAAAVLLAAPVNRTSAIAAASVAAIAILMQQYAAAVLQGEQRFAAFNLIRVAPLLTYSVGVAGLFLADETSLAANLVVWTGSWALSAFAAVALVAVRQRVVASDARTPSGQTLLAFGLRGVIGWMSPVEGLRVDQQIVGVFLGPSALGGYVVGQSFTNLPRFLGVSIGAVSFPRVAALAGSEDARRAVWRYAGLTLAICGPLVVALEFLSPWLVPLFFGREFALAVPITQVLLPAALMMSLRRVLAEGVRGLGLPGIATIAEIVSWVALLAAAVPLAYAFGAAGVAAALVVSSTVCCLLLAISLYRWPEGVGSGHACALPAVR